MKRILLLTIQDNRNYGNRLQNYALQTILECEGCEVDNLFIKEDKRNKMTKPIKLAVKKCLYSIGFSRYGNDLLKQQRKIKNKTFTDNYIHNKKYVGEEELWINNWDDYDYAISGSDQVWHNWKNYKRELESFYLEFVEPRKRITYAPSFGFAEFPDSDKRVHESGLKEISVLSCREQEGCDLIKQLSGREATKVLDPTLLLEADEWIKLEKKPAFQVSEHYLLLFFLGDISPEYWDEIKKIKESGNLEILNINNSDDIKHSALSPNEFLWLIHHADTVCTDSFHASVFAIVFNRKLRVFERVSKLGNMFGRLKDLLEPLGLMHLAYGYGDGDNLITDLTERSKKSFESERQRSLQYLRASLSLNED